MLLRALGYPSSSLLLPRLRRRIVACPTNFASRTCTGYRTSPGHRFSASYCDLSMPPKNAGGRGGKGKGKGKAATTTSSHPTPESAGSSIDTTSSSRPIRSLPRQRQQPSSTTHHPAQSTSQTSRTSASAPSTASASVSARSPAFETIGVLDEQSTRTKTQKKKEEEAHRISRLTSDSREAILDCTGPAMRFPLIMAPIKNQAAYDAALLEHEAARTGFERVYNRQRLFDDYGQPAPLPVKSLARRFDRVNALIFPTFRDDLEGTLELQGHILYDADVTPAAGPAPTASTSQAKPGALKQTARRTGGAPLAGKLTIDSDDYRYRWPSGDEDDEYDLFEYDGNLRDLDDIYSPDPFTSRRPTFGVPESNSDEDFLYDSELDYASDGLRSDYEDSLAEDYATDDEVIALELTGILDPEGTLDADIWELYDTRQPGTGVLKARQKLLELLETFMNNQHFYWGHRHNPRANPIRIEPFGSVRFGLATELSDLDMCLFDPYRPEGFTQKYFSKQSDVKALPEIYNPRSLATRLQRLPFIKKVIPIAYANVPIVKIEAVVNGYVIQGDINTNERLGVLNSRLIDAYCKLHPMFRPFCVFLKHWARQRELNDPSGSKGVITMSSYTIILLAINYLQHVKQLPNLQDDELIRKTRTRRTRFFSTPKLRKRNGGSSTIQGSTGWDTTFVEAYPGPWYKGSLIRRTGLLTEWALGFFAFYSGDGPQSFDYERQVVSIKTGRPIERERQFVSSLDVLEGGIEGPSPTVVDGTGGATGAETNSTLVDGMRQLNIEPVDVRLASRSSSPVEYGEFEEPRAWQQHAFVVQDPFFVERNTASNVRPDVVEVIQSQMRRAKDLIRNGAGLEAICAPIAAGDGSKSVASIKRTAKTNAPPSPNQQNGIAGGGAAVGGAGGGRGQGRGKERGRGRHGSTPRNGNDTTSATSGTRSDVGRGTGFSVGEGATWKEAETRPPLQYSSSNESQIVYKPPGKA